MKLDLNQNDFDLHWLIGKIDCCNSEFNSYLFRNYDAELYACTHRFGEKMNIETLRQAMTDASFLKQIVKQRTEAGRK